MLSHILRQVQAYERRHGIRPNVVYINPDHLRCLRLHHPWLFRNDPAVQLGFRLAVVEAGSLVHPEALWVASRRVA
jgi:hypothetical protein